MPEKVMPGPVGDSCGIREAVCIHTRKIFDSCRDKDCIEDLRFYPKLSCVETLNRAQSVKAGSAKLLYVYVDVEPVSFNRGFYTVDMRFFYHVTLQAYLNCSCPVSVEGLCVFDKRAILFGSEGSAKIFSSQMRVGECDAQLGREANTPSLWWRPWIPSSWTPGLWIAVAGGIATATCARCPASSTSASPASCPAVTRAAGST